MVLIPQDDWQYSACVVTFELLPNSMKQHVFMLSDFLDQIS